MNRGFVAGLFALLAFLDWTIVARITLLIAAVNFVMNPDPMARMASLVMMGVMLLLVKAIKRHLAKQQRQEAKRTS